MRGVYGPRRFHPGEEKTYSVWNMKTKARERNYGSRVDFILAGSGCREGGAAPAPDQAEVRRAFAFMLMVMQASFGGGTGTQEGHRRVAPHACRASRSTRRSGIPSRASLQLRASWRSFRGRITRLSLRT